MNGVAMPKAENFAVVGPGDPAPWFHQRSTSNPRYAFDTVAGRYVVLLFFGSATAPAGRSAVAAMMAGRNRFDDERACCFGVSFDPRDEAEGHVREHLPGIRQFWDFDGTIGRLYGALPRDADLTKPVAARQFWLVLDPTLRVMARFPVSDEGNAAVFAHLDALPPPDRFAGFEVPAPVLVLPNVFEPELCKHLISLHDRDGGRETGFMREVNGKTVEIQDHGHKRRRDFDIADPALIKTLQGRIMRRVNPEITKVHAFTPTRMERYIVSCYSAEDGGHFRPHRDNTTKGTAHRRFAVSINLNDAFEGGELSFPEYGKRAYKAPPGGAVVFGGTLLHAVSKVTSGRRYAFLPFLYDEAAAKIREANNAFIDGPKYEAAPKREDQPA